MDRRNLLAILFIVVIAAVVVVVLNETRDNPAPVAGDSTTPADPPTTVAPTTTSTPISSTTTTDSVSPSSTLAPGESACDRYQLVEVAGTVESSALVEASGIAASRTEPGVIWAHNDSGDDPIVYAVGPAGEDLGSFSLGGGLAFDWEDMAIGPGPDPGRSYLYIGDIGDNFLIRKGRVSVYRVPEPDPGALDATIPVESSFVLDAPDGAHDFEALFIADGSIYLVTKDEQPTRVYRSVESGDGGLALELAATLDLGAEVTAADISWDGSTIVLRGYSNVWMWHRAPGTTVADALSSDPCTAPSPDEAQGEAIAFLSDGSVVTVSEGAASRLHVMPRAP